MLTRLYCAVVARIKSEEGATAVEYGIMVALIAAVIVGIVYSIGQELETAFQTVLTELQK